MTPLGLYLHWPYCRRVCPYCDFNVRRTGGAADEALLAPILADIAGHAGRLGRRPLASVFLGGGTPSLFSPRSIEAILETCARAFGLEPDCEITLEANPEDRAGFAGLVAAGVNRLSLGVQALDDPALKALGRLHRTADAMDAAEVAAGTGARVSLDLIYARPGQSLRDWERELRAALALPAEHLSLYQLTLEEGTPFARAAARGQLIPQPSEAAADFYLLTQTLTEAAGALAYEVSNHARTAAAQSRHNLLYWRGEEWIGVGPGAHGRVAIEGRRCETTAWRDPARYAAAVAKTGVGWEAAFPLAPETEAEERVLMGLRLAEGLPLAPVEALLGRPLDPAPILEAELGAVEDGRLILNVRGRLLADRAAALLLSS